MREERVNESLMDPGALDNLPIFVSLPFPSISDDSMLNVICKNMS